MKSYATTYPMFLALEFIDSALGSGTFMGAFILAVELVGPKKRVLGGTGIMCCYTVGVILLGFMAMFTQHFRLLLRIVYAPALLILSYLWIVPESARWLMVTGKNKPAVDIILKAADTNKVKLSDGMLQNLYEHCNSYSKTNNFDQNSTIKESNPFLEVCRSRVLVLRILGCCFCWVVNAFVHYGLTLNSVSWGGSKYVVFNLINVIEIPGTILTYILMNRMGRRWSLCGTMVICGLACFGTLFVPASHQDFLRLQLFLIGKLAITTSFGIVYVYTAEIFPTNMRNGLMSTCSMVGRIGSMLAPQTPLLVTILHYIF